MQELATEGGRLAERDGISNSGDWSGIVSSFAAMKRLSGGGRDKDNKLRISKNGSLGDYQTLLWSLFDAGSKASFPLLGPNVVNGVSYKLVLLSLYPYTTCRRVLE